MRCFRYAAPRCSIHATHGIAIKVGYALRALRMFKSSRLEWIESDRCVGDAEDGIGKYSGGYDDG